MDFQYTIAIVLLPFAAFLFNGLTSARLPHRVGGWIATIALGISTILSYVAAYQYFIVSGSHEKVTAFSVTWLRFSDALHADMGVMLDPISVMMLVVISTVSLMVFLYSLGYMKEERGFVRYFSFLSLFSFSMLGLVIATRESAWWMRPPRN